MMSVANFIVIICLNSVWLFELHLFLCHLQWCFGIYNQINFTLILFAFLVFCSVYYVKSSLYSQPTPKSTESDYYCWQCVCRKCLYWICAIKHYTYMHTRQKLITQVLYFIKFTIVRQQFYSRSVVETWNPFLIFITLEET